MAYKVLVLDDEFELRDLVCDLLSIEGFMTVRANDGEHAIEILSSDPSVDLVISDLKMPGMDGLQFHGVCRERFPHLPFILMSGHGIPSDIDAIEPSHFVRKPFSFHELIQAVHEALSKQKT
jgi:DNA-binding NtrC family response regulator